MRREGGVMNQATKWKRFLKWWREIEDKSDLYPPSNLAQMIRVKIRELQTIRSEG